MEEHCVVAAEGEEATVSTSNTPDTPKLAPTDTKAELKIWNPMAFDYFCKENHFGISPVLATGYRLIGKAIFDLKKTAAPINLSDVPCQIFDGIRCWRVNCPYAHETFDFDTPTRKQKVKNPVVSVQEEIPEKVPINYITNLLEKAIAPADCIMEVTVTYVKNPGEFYVNCEKGWGCSLADNPEETCPRSILEAKLTDELLQDSYFNTLIYPEYIQFQLVAVMRMKDDKKIFVRGVVSEETDHEIVDNDYIKVQLLDTGEKLRVKRTEICGLPNLYTDDVAVLAYQCSLFRITPLMHEWTNEDSQFFQKLIMGKKCIIIIKRSATVREDAPPILFEDFGSYQVELRTTCADPECLKYHDITKVLSKYGHGVLRAKNMLRPQGWAAE